MSEEEGEVMKFGQSFEQFRQSFDAKVFMQSFEEFRRSFEAVIGRVWAVI